MAASSQGGDGEPDYRYDWPRDSWVVLRTLLLLKSSIAQDTETSEAGLIQRHLAFLREARQRHGLHPFVQRLDPDDGAPRDNWSIQPDGAALGALTLAEYLEGLRQAGDPAPDDLLELLRWYVEAIVRDGRNPQVNFQGLPMQDLWEQMTERSLFAELVQLAALEAGARLADQLGLAADAEQWRAQAQAWRRDLDDGWYDPGRGHFKAHWNAIPPKGFYPGKPSNLDAAAVGGWLYAGGPWAPRDPRLLATVRRLDDTFRELYPVNGGLPAGVVLWGRFAEDRWGGVQFDGGNPWPLTTLWRVRFLYRYALALVEDTLREHGSVAWVPGEDDFLRQLGIEAERGSPSAVVGAVWDVADRTLEHLLAHLRTGENLPEQLDRTTGEPRGARNLTWANAELLMTVRDQRELQTALERAAAGLEAPTFQRELRDDRSARFI